MGRLLLGAGNRLPGMYIQSLVWFEVDASVCLIVAGCIYPACIYICLDSWTFLTGKYLLYIVGQIGMSSWDDIYNTTTLVRLVKLVK